MLLMRRSTPFVGDERKPLEADDPLIGLLCYVCGKAFVVGDILRILHVPMNYKQYTAKFIHAHCYMGKGRKCNE